VNNGREEGYSKSLSSNRAGHPEKTILLGLVGQPNVGKSTIFNLLTGLSQHVGNWPGKTVERKEGTFSRSGMTLRIVDLPGTYSLTANSTEERIARDFILHEHPDLMVMVADASALERNLYLLSELLVLPVPVVLALNMIDVAETQGVQVEARVLEAALGIPVVPLVASKNRGVSELIDSVARLSHNPGLFQPARPEIAKPHRQVLAGIRSLVSGQVPEPYHEGWVALKLLEGDAEITENAQTWLPEKSWWKVEELLKEHEDAILDIASGRYEWIARMVRAAVTRPRLGQVSVTDRLDRVAVHPLWGLLLLLSAFGLVFWLTFTLAAPVQEWLDVKVVGGLQNWLTAGMAGAPTWLVNLLAEGVLGGAGVVVTFIPILAVFYAALGFLEDSGYLARAAYVMDRFMHFMGLHGKSFLPLFLGFGCNVPAVMGTRVIASPGGRLLTILLAPLVPCSARLVVLAFLAPTFFGQAALLVSWSLVSFNLLVLAVVGVVLSKTLFRGQHTAFIMELPLYHLPNPRTIGIFIWNNIWAFLRKAGTLIVLISVLIWALSSYPGTDVEQSYLAQFGRTLDPLGQLMGLDWRMIVALLSSFIAKENAIATLGILYGTGEETAGLTETMVTMVSPAAGLSFLVVSMLFIPCVATVAVMLQETRSWRWTIFSVLLLLGIALGAGIAVYQCAQWLGLGI
jgi:ferrous iron transport protein B